MLKTLVGDTINLSEVFLNFDKALWRSFKQMFDVATLKGYAQQWKEEIWSRITKGDLTWVFLKEEKINELLKQLMSLAFLPPELIPTVFEALKSQVDSNKVMKVKPQLKCFVTGKILKVCNPWLQRFGNAPLQELLRHTVNMLWHTCLMRCT